MVFGDGNATAEAIGYVMYQVMHLDATGSADAIAELIGREEYSGVCRDAGKCAAHAWVDRNTWAYRGLASFTIGSGSVVVYLTDGGRFVFSTPKHVADFVRNFDSGKYPSLVKAA